MQQVNHNALIKKKKKDRAEYQSVQKNVIHVREFKNITKSISLLSCSPDDLGYIIGGPLLQHLSL